MTRHAAEFWIIGTSLGVYPAADLWRSAPSDCAITYIDPNPGMLEGDRIRVIADTADRAVPGLVRRWVES